MDAQNEYRTRLITGIQRMDNLFFRSGRRLAQLISEYRYLIAVLMIGFIVWAVVFNIALVDYLSSSWWNSRGVWLGSYPGTSEFNLFGYTINYQLEGYTDYSYFYVHWGHNILNGMLPYTEDFGRLSLDGYVNENGLFMFPPLTAYLYGAGIWLENIIGPGNWGIGLILASFGYFTALPVYGIARHLSDNPRVGEIATLTYLLNPLVLYHVDYVWLNPSAFYFFFFTGFYALLKNRRHTGTILIVTAALFKQTAWFLGIPLVIFLLLRKRNAFDLVLDNEDSEGPLTNSDVDKMKKGRLSFLNRYFDFRAFAVSVVVAVSYAGAIMLPTLIAQPHFWNYWQLAAGYFSFNGNFVDVPSYGVPETLPVLAIVAGMSDVASILEQILITSAPLIFGVVVFAGLMVLLDKIEGNERVFMRRLLFLTMLLMLWVSLVGPRGVFKYYFALFGPFFSIFASGRMIRGKDDHVPVSLSMFLMPFAFTLLILIPDRNIYLMYAVLIFILYLLAPVIDRLYDIVKRPFRFLKDLISRRNKIELETLELDHYSPSPLRRRILEYIIIISSALLGAMLLVLGPYICFTRVTASISVILQFFMVGGVMIVMGAKMLSIAANGLLSEKERRTDLNYVLMTLSFTIAVLVLVFGLVTYVLSWNIDAFIERQALVISSVIMVFWVFTVVLKLKKQIRLLAGLFLLASAFIASLVWYSLGDEVMYNLGLAGIAGLILYIMFVLLEFLDSTKTTDETDVAEHIEIETRVQ
ncbi:MAG: hypothetical protein E4H14_01695 [Candidatus Thorarchaeota archaeon]|nr:MAG: hypothetical protein E4H14_01695 [Candidatus Thorarchaeota archaeon]